jgi:16S rRNA (adenine1518-N6/adenine1519-N6)-dimethyltransferase
LSIKAKKRFGQNFLKDSSVVDEIIKAIPNDKFKVVEIGAGLGDLTKHLLKFRDVVAFEIDLELCEYLRAKFSDELQSGQLKLFCGDVLDFWKENTLFEEEYKLIANLPYYVATNIILKSLDDKMCQSITVMIQKEVADKFLAKVGDREFSSLSVIGQSVSDVNFIVSAPPSSFDPPPKVDSTVIQFKKSGEKISAGFKELLKLAFQQPRKTLAKNLSQKYQKEKIETIFTNLNIEKTIRPHQIEIKEYHQIYSILEGSDIGRERGINNT